MYYHTAMRWLVLLAIIMLLPVRSEASSERARFTLTEIWQREWIGEITSDWRRERFFEGIDWQIGTVSRGDSEVMTGGFSVVHPYQVQPFSLRHCYVLAAFDLPRGYLLVAVRDPQYYWPEYNVSDGVVDPLELVWFDSDWTEEDHLTLNVPPGSNLDDFLLSPDRRTVLAITHPLDSKDELAGPGQKVMAIDTRSGEIDEIWLPEVDGFGNLPVAWWPVKMQWGRHSNLEVQAGPELRIYTMRWE